MLLLEGVGARRKNRLLIDDSSFKAKPHARTNIIKTKFHLHHLHHIYPLQSQEKAGIRLKNSSHFV